MILDSLARRRSVTILAMALAGGLAGCVNDRIKPSSVPLDDYTARHPIAITQSRSSIDLFPTSTAGRLDLHTAKQVYAFAQQYRELGRGPVGMLVPRGHADRVVVAEIRRVLASGGVRGRVDVATYPAVDPGLASPIRLSYDGIKAVVADQCGQWPRDLASASSIDGWDNKPYWNLGCATQTMIAAQTSDPRDLVTPRGEEPADTLIRSRNIDSLRRGADPNTAWSIRGSNISSIGGN